MQEFPRVTGSAVYAIADDAAGGWFVGGDFASIGGVACRNLVHVSSNRTVDSSWCPRPDGVVRALVRAAGVLYVGGEGMHHIGGVRREGLAALDIKSGHAQPWNPGARSRVYVVIHLAVDAPRRQLLVTGEFTRLGGKPREYLGAVGLTTGLATRFEPKPDATAHGDSVIGTLAAAGNIYAYGFFSEIGGLPRDSFARLHPLNGHALPTEVSPICPTALLAAGRRLYVGTDTACEGVKRPLIALALPRLEPVAWRPALPRRHVEALTLAGGTVVAAAANSHFSKEPRLIAGFDAAGRRVFTSPAHPRGAVQALVAGSGLVLVGVSR